MDTDQKLNASSHSIETDHKTVSEQAQALRSTGDDKIEALELQQEIDKGYLAEIEAVTRQEHVRDWITPYYIVVLMTKPAWGINVMRRRFWARQTLPRSVPSQTVYRYYPGSGQLELLWTLPNLDAINWISHNRQTLPEGYEKILVWVTEYLEKKLDRNHQLAGQKIN